MQNVLSLSELHEVESSLDQKVIAYIGAGEIHTFESFPDFNVIAFEWYDICNDKTETSQMLLYLDAEDFFVFCENKMSLEKARSIFNERDTNEQAFVDFFSRLLKDDMKHLDDIEDRIIQADDAILMDHRKNHLLEIIRFRKELLNLKRYYEQFLSIFEDLADNENSLLTKEAVGRLDTLRSRAGRFLANVTNMQDRVSQMREAYQSQIDIEQNQIMKVFTTVTVIFLPLTLLAGWYGMNLRMPEYEWDLGYPMVILLSVLIGVGLYLYFKKKKWF
jgi:magnesium transporter